MTLRGIKLVTFDVTNTLLRFRIPPHEYYAHVARNHGFKGIGDIKHQLVSSYKDLTKQHPNFGRDSICWNQWWNRVIERTFQGYLPKNANVHEISKQLIEDFKTPSCWELSDGGIDIIKLLKRSGICVGVISNFDPRLHEILTNLSLNSCFEFVLTSYETGICKPDKRIFQHAQTNYGSNISSSQCLHIGDDIDKDYNGAKAAGWQAILITDKSLNLQDTIAYSNLRDLYIAIINNKIKLL